MKLWPPSSEMMEVLISSYCIVQLTSVNKFCTLIKDENRDILIFFPPWSSNTSTVMAILKVKNEGFQLPTDVLFNNISSP